MALQKSAAKTPVREIKYFQHPPLYRALSLSYKYNEKVTLRLKQIKIHIAAQHVNNLTVS
jgi:hypothetical protein